MNKNILVLSIVLLLSAQSSHAFTTLLCSWAQYDDQQNATMVIKDEAHLDCISPKPDLNSDTGVGAARRYHLDILGYGVGLRAAASEAVILHCPTVRSKALGVDRFTNRKGEVVDGASDFYGIKASAGAIVAGADAGVFMNHHGGMCFLIGVQFGSFGAGVAVPKMTIRRVQ